MEHHAVVTGQHIYCTLTHAQGLNVRIPTGWHKPSISKMIFSIRDLPRPTRGSMTSSPVQRFDYLSLKGYELLLPSPPPKKVMENKDLSTNWEHVWMYRLIHSSWRKSSLKLLKQSVALKKQLRHNWNHQPAQKPAGDPPQAPWCQQVFMKAEDSSLGNEDFYNLNSFKKQKYRQFLWIWKYTSTQFINIHAACECGH